MDNRLGGSNNFCQPHQEWRRETTLDKGENKINNTFTKITPLTSSVVSPFQHTKLSNWNRIIKPNLPTIQKEEEEEEEVIIISKGDSAASHHCWREEDKKVLNSIEKHSGPEVLLPNNNIIVVTSQGLLPISPDLSSQARNDMILPGLKSASLISIEQLYDGGCSILLNKRKLIIVKNKD